MRRLLLVLLLALPLRGQDEVVILKLPGMDKVDVKTNIAYGDHKLDLYRPANVKEHLPVVIFVNGIDRAELKEWGQYTSWPRLVAARGMAAVTHTGDLDALLKAIRENGAEWKLDASRIAIWAPRKEPMTLVQLQGLGTDAAISRLHELRKTHPTAYVLQEQTLNALGYAVLAENKPAEAVKWLELAAAWYPESANAHDSLGDAYEAAGRTADAIRESERALQLVDKAHPQRREGIRRSAEEKLKRLRQ